RPELRAVVLTRQRDVCRGGREIDRGAGQEGPAEDGVGLSRLEGGRELRGGRAEEDVGLPVAVDVAGSDAGAELVAGGRSQDAEVNLAGVGQIDHRGGGELRASQHHVDRAGVLVLERRAHGGPDDQVVEAVAVDVAGRERVARKAVRHRPPDGRHGNGTTEELDTTLQSVLTVEYVDHAAVGTTEAVALAGGTDREVGNAVAVEVTGRDRPA